MDNIGLVRLIAAVAVILAYFGINIPEDVIEAIPEIIGGFFLIYTAWKNNDVTKEAKEASDYMNKLKNKK